MELRRKRTNPLEAKTKNQNHQINEETSQRIVIKVVGANPVERKRRTRNETKIETKKRTKIK